MKIISKGANNRIHADRLNAARSGSLASLGGG